MKTTMAIISTKESESGNENAPKKRETSKKSVLIPEPSKQDEQLEPSLRPQNFLQYIGQPKLKELLRVCIGADRKSTRLNSSHSAKSRMPSSA